MQNRAVSRARLIFATAVTALSKSIPYRLYRTTEAAYGRETDPPSRRFSRHKHPSDAQHRTAEEYNWRRQNILTLIAITFAGTATIFAFWTWQATQSQARAAWQTYVATTRAWEDIVPDERTFTLYWDTVTGIVLTGNIKVTNHGSSPGLDGLVSQWIGFYYGDADLSGTANKACSQVDVKKIGSVVFPGTEIPTDIPAKMSKQFIEDFRRLPWMKDFQPNNRPVGITYGVCVAYKITADNSWRQTGKAYRLSILTNSISGASDFVKFGQSVPVGSLVLARVAAGDYAN